MQLPGRAWFKSPQFFNFIQIVGVVEHFAGEFCRGVGRRFVGQPRRRLAHVELAGHDVGDEAGAVFAEEVDFAFEAGDVRR
jgi:hypothetical protein